MSRNEDEPPEDGKGHWSHSMLLVMSFIRRELERQEMTHKDQIGK